jgi:hypothetical protein
MDIILHGSERTRVETKYSSDIHNFVDISSLKDCAGLCISNWSLSQQYIEIRKKNNQLAMFVFNSKGIKHQVDLEYWADAEVVFSINEVTHNK